MKLGDIYTSVIVVFSSVIIYIVSFPGLRWWRASSLVMKSVVMVLLVRVMG